MTIKHIQVLSEAEADLYETQEQGVGEYFWDSLISDVESLIIYAGVHSKEHGYYRMSSKRFPYSIYYDLNGNTAYVIAILPERRNPNWVRSKFRKKHPEYPLDHRKKKLKKNHESNIRQRF